MELLTLNSSFQPDKIFEGYQSLIWSERYSKFGDFQLTTSNIASTIASLPLESYVSLRDSTVPMLIETHKIEKKKNAAPLLTVTGRTFEYCALSRRLSVNSLPSGTLRPFWAMPASKESDAAYKALRVVLGDIARSQGGTSVLSSISPAVSAYDAIPELDLILPNDYETASPYTFEIKAGELYITVIELIAVTNHGIKSIRPGSSGSKVGVEIYNGADLTNDLVIDARFDQIEDATYLLSATGSANVGYIYSSNGSQEVLKTAGPEPSGLARRLLLLDDSSNAATVDVRNSRGLVELYKYNVTALFDGEVAEQIAAGYNTKYFLGDILKLTGEYGLSQNVRVTEFIRSQDNTGEKAYPTFEAVD